MTLDVVIVVNISYISVPEPLQYRYTLRNDATDSDSLGSLHPNCIDMYTVTLLCTV